MTEPAQYPRSVAGLMTKFIVFFALAGAITWWIVPHNAGKPTQQSAAKSAAAPAPARKTAARTSSKFDHRPAYVRKEDNVEGGHWVIYSDGAFMHTNASGSSLQLNFTGNNAPSDVVPLLRARSVAIHAGADPALNITDDQRKQLRAIRVNGASGSTREQREHMRQAWNDYEAALNNSALSPDAKTAAENKLTQTLSLVGAAAHESSRQRFIAIADQIHGILSSDQVNTLSKPRPATRS